MMVKSDDYCIEITPHTQLIKNNPDKINEIKEN